MMGTQVDESMTDKSLEGTHGAKLQAAGCSMICTLMPTYWYTCIYAQYFIYTTHGA